MVACFRERHSHTSCTLHQPVVCPGLRVQQVQVAIPPTTHKHNEQAFLESQACDPALVERVLEVLEGIGFKDELAAGPGARPLSIETQVVQDADRWGTEATSV